MITRSIMALAFGLSFGTHYINGQNLIDDMNSYYSLLQNGNYSVEIAAVLKDGTQFSYDVLLGADYFYTEVMNKTFLRCDSLLLTMDEGLLMASLKNIEDYQSTTPLAAGVLLQNMQKILEDENSGVDWTFIDADTVKIYNITYQFGAYSGNELVFKNGFISSIKYFDRLEDKKVLMATYKLAHKPVNSEFPCKAKLAQYVVKTHQGYVLHGDYASYDLQLTQDLR